MNAVRRKQRLVIIESTDDSVEEAIRKGLWSRHYRTLSLLTEFFEIQYYTSDHRSFQREMPVGVAHNTSPLASSLYGLRHILYYLYLIVDAVRWRRAADVINILGVNQPIVPFIKVISGLQVVSVYHYEWAAVTSTNYRWYQPKTLFSPIIQHLSLGSSDCIICTTERLMAIVRARYPRIPSRLVPNYVNTGQFRPVVPKKKQIVFVGRLHWSKGVDTLIDAFAILGEPAREFSLIIVGSGEEMDTLRERSTSNARIRFTGPTAYNEVAVLLNSSLVFVLPSKTMEGLPRAMIEAMAAGCRCVVSDVPGNREIMQEMGCTDYLFAPGNAQSLADRLAYAIGNENDPRQYDFAVARYAEHVVMDQYVAVLSEFARIA